MLTFRHTPYGTSFIDVGHAVLDPDNGLPIDGTGEIEVVESVAEALIARVGQ